MNAAKTANDAWLSILSKLVDFKDGKATISPRGQKTFERLAVHEEFDMNFPVCYHQDRKLNYSFAAAEAYAITHGVPDAHFLVRYNANMGQFSDDGYIFNGAYGPPFHNQVMYVVNSLINDQQSRQAVLTIWRQNPVRACDVACTLSMQFLIRDGYLNAIVTMRSSDAWLGIPYDFLNFTVMALRILTLVNAITGQKIRLGVMHWQAGSSHLYHRDLEKAQLVRNELPNKMPAPIPVEALVDWRFITDSLHACMDKTDKQDLLWKIRP